MLFVWLFALTAGIVNACVADPGFQAAASAGHDRASLASLEDGAAAHVGTEGHAPVALADHGAPCLKSCIDEASTVPTLKQASSRLSGLWLPPQQQPLVAGDPQPERGSGTHADARMLRDGIPIVIAFLRLTL